LEAKRFLIRSKRLHELPAADLARMARELRELNAGATVISIDEDILERACRPSPVEPLRSLDAIHVATLSKYREEIGPLAVLSADDRVRDNAASLGLEVLP